MTASDRNNLANIQKYNCQLIHLFRIQLMPSLDNNPFHIRDPTTYYLFNIIFQHICVYSRDVDEIENEEFEARQQPP
jgi:hypothetical protein